MSGREGLWSIEDTERLKMLCAEGITKSQAAAEFQCSVKRVCNKARQLGLGFLRENGWSDIEIMKFERLAKRGWSVSRIARELGRTCCSIEAMGYRRGIHVSNSDDTSVRHGDAWTSHDEDELERMLEERRPIAEIAFILGRSDKAVRSRMGLLGLTMKAG